MTRQRRSTFEVRHGMDDCLLFLKTSTVDYPISSTSFHSVLQVLVSPIALVFSTPSRMRLRPPPTVASPPLIGNSSLTDAQPRRRHQLTITAFCFLLKFTHH